MILVAPLTSSIRHWSGSLVKHWQNRSRSINRMASNVMAEEDHANVLKGGQSRNYDMSILKNVETE